jgi:hypothetical protein
LQVEGELRELRCHYGNIHYRILHRRSRNLVILLHCFIKRTPRIPQREIDIANARWEDYKERMGSQTSKKASRGRARRATAHEKGTRRLVIRSDKLRSNGRWNRHQDFEQGRGSTARCKPSGYVGA